MGNHFLTVKKDEKTLPLALEFFNTEYELAREELKIKGKLIESISKLSSNFEIRFSQLQEIEAILEHFNIKLRQMKSSLYQKYLENYQRALSSSDISKYIEGVPEVVAYQQIINEIALVRNKFLSLTKGFETKNWQLSNITKLQCAGLNDIEI